MKSIDLLWQGPLRVGELNKATSALSGLDGPHLYFCVQVYHSKTVAYVGQTQNFWKRMLDYYEGFLGFAYWLRDNHGKPRYKPSKDRTCFVDLLDKKLEFGMEIAVEEVKRLQFFCARCDDPNLIRQVEAALIGRVWGRAKKSAPGPKKLECDNSRRERYGSDLPPISITNHPSSAAADEYLELLFGPKPIRWGQTDG
ncbi:MAG: hypothetical protein IIA73_09585 [Proteobacteria bacterium]|nr:hypothetical protein [Pseudomonadota bacterium]